LVFSHPILPAQEALLSLPLRSKAYLFGEATSGKTRAAQLRLNQWLDNGIHPSKILILTPQRMGARPYEEAAHHAGVNPAGLTYITMGGLARRMCQLFWPLVQESFPFAQPIRQPTFLTLETAQYYLSRIVDPLLDKGFFASITVDRNRLYSQILDNLNKGALSGLSPAQITDRLIHAWVGDESQIRVYQDAQVCAETFRSYCFDHHLLDYSLQMEIFSGFLWQHPLCRAYLQDQYTHLIYDNLEEDPLVIHQIMHEWLPVFQSCVLVHDVSGGFRLFMGADPLHAGDLKELCEYQLAFSTPLHQTKNIQSIRTLLQSRREKKEPEQPVNMADVRSGYEISIKKYIPEMLDWIAETVADQIENHSISPGEIAILSPFVSDTLYFSLTNRLNAKGYGLTTHRPSRSLKDEPATRTMLNLAKLAHPQWELPVSQHALRIAFMQTLTHNDLLVADRVSRILYNGRTGQLSSFSRIKPEIQEQISYQIGEKIESLREWILAYQNEEPLYLDSFLGKLYGELLSQPGYSWHGDFNTSTIIARLMSSIKNFRWANHGVDQLDPLSTGKSYIEMVERGILAATSYTESTQKQHQIFLLPAYTYLTGSYQSKIQFWLDPGNPSWAERLYQPLTHPYVLSPNWPENKPWTQLDEQRHQTETLNRIINGLLLKCSDKVYFCISKLNEQGQEMRGPMLSILQDIFRTVAVVEKNRHV
jgi:hypothetical protein